MSQLYLPVAHTEADLVLAGQIAERIDSGELYVTWTPEHGRAIPEVVAELRAAAPTWSGMLAAFVEAARELLAALRGQPLQREARAQAAEQRADEPKPAG